MADLENLGRELLVQIKGQLVSLGAELKAEVEPDLWALNDRIITFGTRYATGEDVTLDLMHIRTQAELIAGIVFTKAGNKFQETLITIAETAARVLGAAMKAAA